MNRSIRIAVIDDHPLMREGIIATLKEHRSSFEVVGSGGSSIEAIALAKDQQPDVMILDVGIPGGGLEALAEICTANPLAKVIIFTVSDRAASIVLAFEIGAKGYILKGTSSEELVRAIDSVAKGNTYVSPELAGKIFAPGKSVAPSHSEAEGRLRTLSARELEIMQLLNHGLSNKDIASQLSIGEKTVKYYLTTMFDKLAVKNWLEAVIFFRDTNRQIELHPKF